MVINLNLKKKSTMFLSVDFYPITKSKIKEKLLL